MFRGMVKSENGISPDEPQGRAGEQEHLHRENRQLTPLAAHIWMLNFQYAI